MNIGKPDGKHFSLTFNWRYGASIFILIGRGRGCVSAGFGWRLVGEAGFKPHIAFFRLVGRPFARMWHLRRPFNVVRVGMWA